MITTPPSALTCLDPHSPKLSGRDVTHHLLGSAEQAEHFQPVLVTRDYIISTNVKHYESVHSLEHPGQYCTSEDINMNIPSFQTREKASEDAYIRKREAEKAAAAKQNSGAQATQAKTTQGDQGAQSGTK